MAAAARAPGPADARIPCPLCGGLIHPIAGRCKHCKEDLSALRAARPAAAATLPALASPQHPYVSPAAPYAASAPAVPAAAISTVGPANAYRAIPVRGDESQPILPPRPTGRMPSTPPRAGWKSWPVIVIALAVIAIVAAVVLMVWPPGASTKANAGTLAPPPAPERMETNPLPPQRGAPPGTTPRGSIDPWTDRNRAAPDPAPAPPTPAPPSTTPDPAPYDPFGTPRGTRSPIDLLGNIAHRACDRLASCPQLSAEMRMLCVASRQMMPPQPTTCPAEQRCLARFDAILTCDADIDSLALVGLLQGMDDCADALRC